MTNHQICDGWASLRWHQNSEDRHRVRSGDSESSLTPRGEKLKYGRNPPCFSPDKGSPHDPRKSVFSPLGPPKNPFFFRFGNLAQLSGKVVFSPGGGKNTLFLKILSFRPSDGFSASRHGKSEFFQKNTLFSTPEKSSRKPPNSAHPRGIWHPFSGSFALFCWEQKKGVFPPRTPKIPLISKKVSFFGNNGNLTNPGENATFADILDFRLWRAETTTFRRLRPEKRVFWVRGRNREFSALRTSKGEKGLFFPWM